MLCYRDMIFCPFHKDCAHASSCHRPLTEEVIARAAAAGMLISEFVDKPQCHSDNDKEAGIEPSPA